MAALETIDPRELTTPQSEKELQSRVERYAKITGWLFYHTFSSRRSISGFPDVILCHPNRETLFAELKSDGGKPTDAQREWLLSVAASGQIACLWRPKHIEDIARYLAGEITRPPGIVAEGNGWDE